MGRMREKEHKEKEMERDEKKGVTFGGWVGGGWGAECVGGRRGQPCATCYSPHSFYPTH